MKAKVLTGSIVLAALAVAGGAWKLHDQAVATEPATPKQVVPNQVVPKQAMPKQVMSKPTSQKAASPKQALPRVAWIRDPRFEGLPAAPEAPLLSRPLSPGDVAPDFVLPDQKGRMHSLSGLRGKTVVLSFYPQDFTLSCVSVAVDLTDSRPAFQARGAEVFSVSVQPVDSKQRFASRFGIEQPLLADTDRSVARKYRVLNEDGLAGRVTFIIGPDGTILSTDQNVHAQSHARDLLLTLDRLQPRLFQPQPSLFQPRQLQSTRFGLYE